MKYNELLVTKNKSPNRVGRGIAAGQGKTAGRGTKGQNSRSGSSRKPGFEGGSNPLSQRLPKLRGFTSHRQKIVEVYTSQLEKLKDKSIDNQILFKAGIIDSPNSKVKLLVNGNLTRPVDVKLQAASKAAIKAIEKSGGKFSPIDQVRKVKNTEAKSKT